jgi:hypothetical protein
MTYIRARYRPSKSDPSACGRTAPNSDFGSLSQDERIFDVNAEIPDRILNLCVPKQYLDRPKIAGSLVDHGGLRSPHRMRAVFGAPKPDRGHPFIAATFQPREEARPNISGQFELNRSPGLLLNDNRPRPDLGARDQITDLNFDQIAASQLAIDSEVKQRSIPKPSLAFEEKADGPNLLLCQRALDANGFARIPCRT